MDYILGVLTLALHQNYSRFNLREAKAHPLIVGNSW